MTESSIASWMALRVLRVELGRRLPGVEVLALSPTPVQSPLDGGEPVAAAGPWTPERRAELAAGLDCVALLHSEPDGGLGEGDGEAPGPGLGEGPGVVPGWPPPDGLGPEHEQTCPCITVEPESLCALAPQVFDEGVLDLRMAWMRLLGDSPAAGSVLRLDTAGPLSLEDVAALVRSAKVVEGGEDLECLALAYGTELSCNHEPLPGARIDLSTRQLWASTLLDALVSIATRGRAARAVPPPDELGPIAHAARQRRCARYVAVLAEQSGALAEAELDLFREQSRAEVASKAAQRHRVELEGRLAALRQGASEGYARYEAQAAAGEARICALTAEADSLRAEILARTSELEAQEAALAEVEAGRAAIERELEATRATRLFRYAAGPRWIYRAIRRWRG